jgi:tRNA A-37 threonylcarbamoyl transferase component Bud32
MLSAYLSAHGVARLPWLNRSMRMPLDYSARQKSRIQKLYAADFQLVEQLRSTRTATEREILRAMGVAAE